MPGEEVVEPSAEPRDAVRELVRERSLARVEVLRRRVEGAVEPPSSLRLGAGPQGRQAAGADFAQSSIPRVGEDGTAISRDGIRPAR